MGNPVIFLTESNRWHLGVVIRIPDPPLEVYTVRLYGHSSSRPGSSSGAYVRQILPRSILIDTREIGRYELQFYDSTDDLSTSEYHMNYFRNVVAVVRCGRCNMFSANFIRHSAEHMRRRGVTDDRALQFKLPKLLNKKDFAKRIRFFRLHSMQQRGFNAVPEEDIQPGRKRKCSTTVKTKGNPPKRRRHKKTVENIQVFEDNYEFDEEEEVDPLNSGFEIGENERFDYEDSDDDGAGAGNPIAV